jgi:DNA-binding transcriptional regulator YiaG
MPNIASLLKAEIARVARKEVRASAQTLQSATSKHRSDIAALKRKIDALEKQVRRLGKGVTAKRSAAMDEEDTGVKQRFNAKGFATMRKRLGLSAAQMGLVLGVSGQSVYKWEDGKARPRAAQVASIASIRGLGKKVVMAKLEANQSA